MPGEILTRKQTQARTLETVLDAAQTVLLAEGYHATTIAKIAKAAGYTPGAIYSNFASKDELCTAVIERVCMDEFAKLTGDLAEAAPTLDGRIAALERWWTDVVANQTGVLVFGAEFLLAIRNDPELSAQARGFLRIAKTFIETAVESHLGATGIDAGMVPLPDVAAIIGALGIGLGLDHAFDAEQTIDRFGLAVRILLAGLKAEAHG